MVPGILKLAYKLQANYQAGIAYLQARTQRLQDTVALFLALGGGWDAGAGQAQARQAP